MYAGVQRSEGKREDHTPLEEPGACGGGSLHRCWQGSWGTCILGGQGGGR